MQMKTNIHVTEKRGARQLNHALAGLMCVLMALLLSACGIVRPSPPAFVAEEGTPTTAPIVQLDFEYEDADATDVALLWRVKADVDTDTQPAEAETAAAAAPNTQTPMHKEGDLFTSHITVPEGAQLEFNLLITTNG